MGSFRKKAVESESPNHMYDYQRKVGSILCVTCITRLDVAKAANKIAEFLRNPSPIHDAAANRAITYLYQTRTPAIEYSARDLGSQVFTTTSDAAFANDSISRRSTEGYLFTLFGEAID